MSQATLTMNRTRHALAPWARIAGLTLCALLTLGPVSWTVSTSLRTPAESFDLPPKIIPTDPTVDSYQVSSSRSTSGCWR